MKKTLVLAAMALTLAFAGAAGAQMNMVEGEPGMMRGEGHVPMGAAPQDMSDMSDMMDYYGMMGGCGMGPGMMGGYGMGPGMMGGYGMGPGMMGPEMMGRYGMGPGMMGCRSRHMQGNCYGFGKGQGWTQEEHEKFRQLMDDTKDLRRQLYMMRFDYREMLRNPDTTLKDKMDMERKMFELRQQIQKKFAQKP